MVLSSKKLKKFYLKVVSFIFSMFLWIYVVSSENVILEKTFAIKYINPENYAVSSQAPVEVSYTFKGPRAFLRDFIEKENEITINLGNMKTLKKNQYLVNFKNVNINLPFGISLVSSNPERRTIDVEPEVSKLVQVEPSFIGKVDKELKITTQQLNRKKILVSGPSTLVNSIKQIDSSPIDLGLLKTDGSIKLDLNIPDNRLRIIDDEPIVWEYTLRANKANKKISNVPVTFVSSKFIKNSSHKMVDLTVLANEEIDLTNFSSNVSVIAEVPNNASGKVSVTLKVKLPEKVLLLEVLPATIDIYVK